MKRFFFLIFAFLILCSFISATTPPELPMIISGNVSINDRPAGIGTEITALMGDEEVANSEVSEAGKFTLLLQKLEEGQQVGVYVDGIYTNQTISYKSGDFQQLSLKVKKSYLIYYLGAALIIIIGLLTWKRKLILKRKK